MAQEKATETEQAKKQKKKTEWKPTNTDIYFAKALEFYIERHNLSRSDIAKMADRSTRTIDYVIALERGIGKEPANKIARALGTQYARMIAIGHKLIKKGEEIEPPTTNEPDDLTPPVRRYREIEAIDNNILKEIKKWLTAMEAYTPGFTSWFRLEFQNRFPEFDEWKKGKSNENLK